MIGRVAIVTGGTGALGRFIVNKFADEGLTVYVPVMSTEKFNSIFDSSRDKDSEYFKVRKIFCKVCNATDEISVAEFVENVVMQEKGKLDILINTVGGICPSSNITELSTEDLDMMIDLNFKSAFYFTRESVRMMQKNSYGRVVSIGSIAGLQTTPGRFAYSYSKAGLICLMDTVSEEMKDENIRCNTIIPGIIDTPANREWGSPEEIKKWVKPEEITKIIYDLVSEKYSSLRSSNLKVYGSY
jgi:NAD(P)-dependent dehydrogenase (short-subunit alcohol dehydrogenase family)